MLRTQGLESESPLPFAALHRLPQTRRPRVFLDLKLHDIPATVDLAKYRAVLQGDVIHDKLQGKIVADVTEIDVEDNQRVEKGQVLLKIDVRDLQADRAPAPVTGVDLDVPAAARKNAAGLTTGFHSGFGGSARPASSTPPAPTMAWSP